MVREHLLNDWEMGIAGGGGLVCGGVIVNDNPPILRCHVASYFFGYPVLKH